MQNKQPNAEVVETTTPRYRNAAELVSGMLTPPPLNCIWVCMVLGGGGVGGCISPTCRLDVQHCSHSLKAPPSFLLSDYRSQISETFHSC